MELEVIASPDNGVHTDSVAVEVPASQIVEDPRGTGPQPAPAQDVSTNQNSSEDAVDERFEIIQPPEVDTTDVTPPPPRRNPVRARNPPSFLQLFRGTKSYI